MSKFIVIVFIFFVAFLASNAGWRSQPVTAADTDLLLSNQISDVGDISPVFMPEVQYWQESIVRWSQVVGIDPNLAATVMQIESCGDPSAGSGAGAMGLFQVMPFHFTASEEPYDPDTNAMRGLNYLKKSLDVAGGNASLAFAGYNGGIGLISRNSGSWPVETIRYEYWGSGIYNEATSGAAVSERLNEWLAAGGASLCASAANRLGLGQ
jgi:hypothetical protein